MSIVTDVQTLINDSSSVFWTTQHIYDAINEAQEDIYVDTKWVLSTATFTLSQYGSVFDMPVTTLIVPQKIIYESQEWFPTTTLKLEQYNRDWRAETYGPPMFFVVLDAYHMRAWPPADKDYEMELVGVGWPAEINGTSTDLGGSRTYQNIVAQRASAILLEATRPDIAQALYSQAEETLHTFKTTHRNRLTNNLRRLRPGTTFTQAQSGTIKMGKHVGLTLT